MDLSGIVTRDDMFAMKQRMVQRGQYVDAMRAAADAPAAPAPATSLPPNAGSVGSFDRCRSLKERIHDRIVRPHGHASPLPPPLVKDGTKDVYAHELPFPVRTVYEVQQIPNPASVPVETRSGYVPETLLLAAESAALVQSLEERLGQALHRIASTEEALSLERTANETLSTRLMIADKEILSLQARNEELLKQTELVRRECQKALDDARIVHAEQLKKVESGERTAGADAVKKVEKVSKDLETQIKDLSVDKRRLEELVTELRNQLVQNAQSLQISTQTVKQLTGELLQAKQQSSFVSSGYKKLESDLRTATAQNVAKDTELSVTRKSTKELEALKDEHLKRGLKIEEMTKELEKLKGADKSNKELKEKLEKLEKEMTEKDARLGELKAHVDQVRQQANAAYLHAKGFGMMEPPSVAYGGGIGLGGGGPMLQQPPPCPVHGGAGLNTSYGGGGGDFDALRREVEAESQRFKEEQRRWKARLEPQSPTRR